MQENPALGKCEFRAKNHWIEGGQNCTTVKDFYGAGQENSRAAAFQFNADEPPVLLGQDSAANPVEYLLTALSSCMTTSMIYHAAARGIMIDDMESDFTGDLALNGFLGLKEDVRPGYQKIRATFRLKSDAPIEQLKELVKFSPVYDVVSKSVPVEVRVEKK